MGVCSSSAYLLKRIFVHIGQIACEKSFFGAEYEILFSTARMHPSSGRVDAEATIVKNGEKAGTHADFWRRNQAEAASCARAERCMTVETRWLEVERPPCVRL